MSGQGFDPMSAAEVVSRALAQRGIGTYKLGGGAKFTAPDAFDEDGNRFPGQCDCSGLLAYAAKYRRGNFNTDAIVRDARGQRTRFRLVGRDELVRPGDFIVKPGPDLDHNGVRDYPGHCGVIVGVHDDFVRGAEGWWEDLDVAHCSGAKQNRIDPKTGKRYGAVRVTNASIWSHAGYLIRPLWVS